jgi:hypothetical protein
MPASPTKRNKKYVSKYVAGVLPPIYRMSAEHESKMIHQFHAALATVLAGQAVLADFSNLALRINMGRTMAMHFFKEEEANELLKNGQLALREVFLRKQNKTGTFVMKAEEHQLIKDCLLLTDDMQKQCKRREMLSVLAEIEASNRRFAKDNQVADKKTICDIV